MKNFDQWGITNEKPFVACVTAKNLRLANIGAFLFFLETFSTLSSSFSDVFEWVHREHEWICGKHQRVDVQFP